MRIFASLLLISSLTANARLTEVPTKSAPVATFSREQVKAMVDQGLLNGNFVVNLSDADMQKASANGTVVKQAELLGAAVLYGAVVCWLVMRAANHERAGRID